MNDKLELDIPVLLPDLPNAADACLDRLVSTLSKREGVERAHVICLDGDTPAAALAQMAAGLAPGGRVAIGFGLGRGYPMGRFTADCAAAGLAIEARFSTWQFHPFTAESQFVVALLARA